jgi:hypothetical protein
MERSLIIAIAVVSTLVIGSWITYFTFGEPIPDVAERNIPGANAGAGNNWLHPGSQRGQSTSSRSSAGPQIPNIKS